MKKLSFYLGLLLIPLAISSTRCKDKPKDEQVDVRLVISMTVTPVRDTFNVNDTLLFEISTPDNILELTTNKYYKIENLNLNSFVTINKLVDNSATLFNQPGGVAKFSYINITGGFSNYSTFNANLNFVYANNRYTSKCKIVCKEAGRYSIKAATDYVRNGIRLNIDIGNTPSGGKKIPYLIDIRYPINNGNNNYNILKDNILTDEERGGTDEQKNYVFAFAVK
jgi:hypothetical protein